MAVGLPLFTLLSNVLVAFTIEFDNEFEHRTPHRTTNFGSRGGPWLVSMVMWWNCMRFVGDEGITVRELEDLARTKTNLNGMERWGYITIEGPPRSAGVIRATSKGRQARKRRAAAVRRNRAALADTLWQGSDPTASGIAWRADPPDGRRAARLSSDLGIWFV